MEVSDPTSVTHNGISKHDLLFLVYNTVSCKNEAKLVSYINHKTMSLDGLLDEGRVDWSCVVNSNSVGTMVDNFNHVLTDLLDRHAPVITKRAGSRSHGSHRQYSCSKGCGLP